MEPLDFILSDFPKESICYDYSGKSRTNNIRFLKNEILMQIYNPASKESIEVTRALALSMLTDIEVAEALTMYHAAKNDIISIIVEIDSSSKG